MIPKLREGGPEARQAFHKAPARYESKGSAGAARAKPRPGDVIEIAAGEER
jgi:hypothetical protein